MTWSSSLIRAFEYRREITWDFTAFSEGELEYLRAANPKKTSLQLNAFGNDSICVRHDDLRLHSLLLAKFIQSKTEISGSEIILLPPSETKPVKGIWDDQNHVAVIYSDSFGIVKSVVSGIGSISGVKNGYFPVHAAAFSIDGCGALIVGASGFGKTTTVLALSNAARSVGSKFACLGDDWCLVGIDKRGNLEARTFDPSISINPDTIHYLPPEHVKLAGIDQRLRDGEKKISIDCRELNLWPFSRRSLSISKVILLDPTTAEDGVFTRVSDDDLFSFVMNTAYHYPLNADKERSAFADFWSRVNARCEVFAVSRRSDGDLSASVEAIRKSLV